MRDSIRIMHYSLKAERAYLRQIRELYSPSSETTSHRHREAANRQYLSYLAAAGSLLELFSKLRRLRSSSS